MIDRSSRLFEVLDPPSDGVADLRARIRADHRRRVRARRLQATSVAAAVVGLAVLFALPPRHRPPAFPTAFGPTAIRLGLTAEPAEPVTVPADERSETAVSRVPVDDERVVFYLVASRTDPPLPVSGGEDGHHP